MGRELTQRPGVRVMPLGRYPYLIFYTVLENELFVLHVRHASRRPLEHDECVAPFLRTASLPI